MNIGDYLNKKIIIKPIKDNIDTYSIHDNGYWMDYRVGCDMCNNGPAFSFKTNINSIIGKNSFTLNDICILHEDFYEDKKLKSLLVCYDKSQFQYLKDIYGKLGKMKCTEHLSYDYDKHSYDYSCSGLGSCFDGHDIYGNKYGIDNVDRVLVCIHCFQWLKLINPDLDNKFEKISPLFVFWSDVLEDIYQMVEFNKDDQIYLNNLFHIDISI